MKNGIRIYKEFYVFITDLVWIKPWWPVLGLRCVRHFSLFRWIWTGAKERNLSRYWVNEPSLCWFVVLLMAWSRESHSVCLGDVSHKEFHKAFPMYSYWTDEAKNVTEPNLIVLLQVRQSALTVAQVCFPAITLPVQLLAPPATNGIYVTRKSRYDMTDSVIKRYEVHREIWYRWYITPKWCD